MYTLFYRAANEVELKENVAYQSTLATSKATAIPHYEEVIIGERKGLATIKEKEPVYDEVLTEESTVYPTTTAEEHQYEEPV